jgi:hypothetical protein
MAAPSLTERTLAWWHIDLKPSGEYPPPGRYFMAVVLAVLGSLGADAVIVAITTHVDTALKGYSHFQFDDYATLTVVGVLAACVAWIAVLRISSAPRWLFLRMAVVVTIVLWMPDVYLLTKHEPAAAVSVLMIMHLAIALVTYHALVHVAKGVPLSASTRTVPAPLKSLEYSFSVERPDPMDHQAALRRSYFGAMMVGVVAEFVIGGAELFYVPLNRPTGWLAHKGETIYVVHALLGSALGIGAFYVVVMALTTPFLVQVQRTAAIGGFLGVATGAFGGVLSYEKSLRIYAIALMFFGVAVAIFCYLLPFLEGSMSRFGSPTTAWGNEQRSQPPR